MRVSLMVCVAALGAVGCTSSVGSSSATVTSLSSTSVTLSASATSTSELPASSETPTSGDDTSLRIDEIVRPIADPDKCETYSANQQTLDFDGEPLTLFARSSAVAVPIQIIASQANGPAGPFAVVQRFFDSNRTPSGVDPFVIGETEVFVSVFDNGNVEATWSLDDGSQGYLRSRGLSRDAVVEIVSGVSPRPDNDPVPGFDYRSTGELDVVVDQLNTKELAGSSAGSQCRVIADGALYDISVLRGVDLVLYASVIDRPPPVDVGYQDGTVVVVAGLDSSGAPTVAGVVNADVDTWQQLLNKE